MDAEKPADYLTWEDNPLHKHSMSKGAGLSLLVLNRLSDITILEEEY